MSYAITHWVAFCCDVSAIFLLFGKFDCRGSRQAKTGTHVCQSVYLSVCDGNGETDRLTGRERRDLHAK